MEAQLLNHIRSLPGTELIGDDAAVIGDRLITVDMLTEGVDFLLAEADPRWIGRKALAVNLSDIAAMGGIPRWVFMAVALPRYPEVPLRYTSGSLGDASGSLEGALELAEQLLSGMQPLIDRYNLVLAGGDTNTWDGGLVISITVIGCVPEWGVFRRSGGKAGDRIFVTGKLGGSILRHQFHFEPRIDEALHLNEHYQVHAAMDISDGLTLDLHRLATESRLGATLYESAIPIADDAIILSQQSGRSPQEHALSDGEDFELLFTVSPQEAAKLLAVPPFELYEIGELTIEEGLRMVTAEGTVTPLTPRGFEH
ncbi:MAG: thiamine-phosphate kinase [Planctomycetaceae bacterium]|nr:thiamine-phosphate kinase [Planctomycetaceae bacterium]